MKQRVNLSYKRATLILIMAIMLTATLGTMNIHINMDEPSAPIEVHTETVMASPSHSSPMLVELFVYIGCVYCPDAEAASYKIQDNYGSSMLFLEHHIWSDAAGWALDESGARAQHFLGQDDGVPSVILDGSTKIDGRETNGWDYNTYKNYIEAEPSNPYMGSDMTVIFEPGEDSITADWDIDILGEVSGSAQAFFVLYQKQASHDGVTYRQVVRDITPYQSGFTAGDNSLTASFPYPLQSANGMGVAAILEDKNTHNTYFVEAYDFPNPDGTTDNPNNNDEGEEDIDADGDAETPLYKSPYIIIPSLGALAVVALFIMHNKNPGLPIENEETTTQKDAKKKGAGNNKNGKKKPGKNGKKGPKKGKKKGRRRR